nr:MAG TPA: hypothetical protein [Caudoviricetes sp.]
MISLIRKHLILLLIVSLYSPIHLNLLSQYLVIH